MFTLFDIVMISLVFEILTLSNEKLLIARRSTTDIENKSFLICEFLIMMFFKEKSPREMAERNLLFVS